jgi:anhydro-N-acetylmuramic acid kinase
MQENYIGIMCGTSLDSLDFSLCVFKPKLNVKKFKSFRLSARLKEIIDECKSKPHDKALFNKADQEVTDFIITSLLKFKKSTNVKEIKAIGYPGITVVHNPKKGISKTLGNPRKIVLKTQIKLISDFRLTDMTVGGQGAPLAPYFHDYISKKNEAFVNILNLGGFANLTFKSQNRLVAYDTGPANYLIDLISKIYFGADYDKSGSIAKASKVNDKALLAMLSDEYFNQDAPKSTGFEKFNLKWLNKFIKKFKLNNKKTLLATVTQLTIITVSDEICKNHLDSPYIFFSGGGSKNTFIKKQILTRTGLTEIKSLPGNLDYKNLEASAFAWFAMKRDKGNLISKAYLTGAKNSRRLGIIYR